MTPEQERELVNIVEEITVILQHVSWEALREYQRLRAGRLNMRLADTFPWIREGSDDA